MTKRIKELEEDIVYLKKNLHKQASGVFHYRMLVEHMDAEIEGLRRENVELKAKLYDVMREKATRNKAIQGTRSLPGIMALAAQVSTDNSKGTDGLGPASLSSLGRRSSQGPIVSNGCSWLDSDGLGKRQTDGVGLGSVHSKYLL